MNNYVGLFRFICVKWGWRSE